MFFGKAELEKLHGKKNQPDSWYVNCGGYALGVSSWYHPGNSIEQIQSEYLHTRRKNQWRNLEKKYVKYILRDFPELRLIPKDAVDNVDVDLDKYELIAFRIRRCAFFCDFHFMKCDIDGNWSGKSGHEGIDSYRFEEIYDKKTWGEYDGKIYFFSRPRLLKEA